MTTKSVCLSVRPSVRLSVRLSVMILDDNLGSLENDPGCIVLHSLQNLNAAGWSTVQH